MQRTHRHVELVVVGVVDPEKLSDHAADGENFETRVASDAMGFVHHRRFDPQLVQVPHDPFRVPACPATTAALGGACAEELRLRDHRQRRRVDARTVLQLGDGHGESGAARDEIAPRLDELRRQTVRAQGFQQDLPPPGRLGDDEASARVCGEEVLQEADGSVRPPVDGQCRRRLRGEPDGAAAFVPVSAAQAHAGRCSQPGEQVLDRNEYLVRGEHGSLAVVAPVPEPIAGVRPECRRGVVDVLGEDHDRARREIVHQGSGLAEEQRQVVLDARRPAALADLPVDRAA